MQNDRSTQRTNTDRFGNAYVLVKATEVIDKKTGAILPIWKGYFEMDGKLIKFELSNKTTQSKDGRNQMWAKFTKQSKRTPQKF